MEKKIQISEKFLTDVNELILRLEQFSFDEDINVLLNNIKKHTEAKIDSLERHKQYTAYKTAAPMSEERETKRKEYLEGAGIRVSWTTARESFYE